ncbi:hypothetical protein B9Z19DRAFT_1124907 [Tuber borchii]|uniref:Uncharacterized protein n=1 Tax=Tuber borchii TaxID=42251 RepID=A0A2T6ZVV1_TUBBO|nr:hypothetical protein B9Z19DRAFT_1124907 [Tuber borchii]
MEHTAKKTQNVPTSAPDETASRITVSEPTLPRRAGLRKTVPTIQSTKPNTRSTRNGRHQNAPTVNSMRSPRTTQNPNIRQNPNSRQTHIASRNANLNARRNANVGSGGGRSQGLNANLG